MKQKRHSIDLFIFVFLHVTTHFKQSKKKWRNNSRSIRYNYEFKDKRKNFE